MPLTHITTCLLCDPLKPKRFTAPAMPDIHPGEQPPQGVSAFLEALSVHLKKAHPQAFTTIFQMGFMLQAFILMKNFTSTDPGLTVATNLVRRFIHQITQDPAWSDDGWLRGFYASLVEDSPTGNIRYEDLKRFRDVMLEQNQDAFGSREDNGTRAPGIVTP